MKTSFVLTLATFLSAAIAMPTATNGGGGGGGSAPAPSYKCPVGLFSVAQCCATDVLGVLDLDCQTPTSGSSSDFGCATGGQRARCCVLPVAGQAALCTAPTPV
ncbi:fungal hydrophobin protein [Rutstroemia sp. NJR-2017a WRK4]|nr:fungal hydrophobin protein [Rutstroemia sp. NJR-2017a WRK4]PQE14891.1 fungal hydrophobin protein [Rutstroemia sp. NJR-2017a WRK4]